MEARPCTREQARVIVRVQGHAGVPLMPLTFIWSNGEMKQLPSSYGYQPTHRWLRQLLAVLLFLLVAPSSLFYIPHPLSLPQLLSLFISLFNLLIWRNAVFPGTSATSNQLFTFQKLTSQVFLSAFPQGTLCSETHLMPEIKEVFVGSAHEERLVLSLSLLFYTACSDTCCLTCSLQFGSNSWIIDLVLSGWSAWQFFGHPKVYVRLFG